jgi:iron complex transport system substrate-binding protein
MGKQDRRSEGAQESDQKAKRPSRGGAGLAVALAVVLVIVIAGAAAVLLLGPTGPCGPLSYIVKDDRGVEVCLERAPERIASLSPSTSEMACVVGLCSKLVALDNNSDYPQEVKDSKAPRVYGFGWFDKEGLKAARPDMVLASGINAKDFPSIENDLKLKLIVLDPKSLDGMLESVGTAGKAGKAEAKAAQVVEDLKKRMDAVKAKLQDPKRNGTPKVYHELDGSTGVFYSVGPGSFGDSLITAAGGENIAAGAGSAYPALKSEDVVAADPAYITCSANVWYKCDPTEIAGRPGWGNLSAVKYARIVNLDSDLIDRPGPRLVAGLEEMLKAIHPELSRV